MEDGAGAIIEGLSDDIKSDVNILLDQAVTTIEQSEVTKHPYPTQKFDNVINIINENVDYVLGWRCFCFDSGRKDIKMSKSHCVYTSNSAVEVSFKIKENITKKEYG